MPGRQISAAAAALAAAGAVVVWAGIKGVSLGSGVRTLLTGKVPVVPADSLDAPIFTGAATAAGAVAAGATGLTGGGNPSIVAAATAYQGGGHVYKWGGGSPAGWDCSGFVNYVLCHDLGLPIPGYKGGSFTGRSHGPVTMQWGIWSGCVNIPRAELAPGDLCVWPTAHMGIAISNTQMVNCPGPNGTPAPVISGIPKTISGSPLVCRRLKVT